MTRNIKNIGYILLAFALNGCGNSSNYNPSSESTTPVWLSEVGKRTIRELTTTTGTAKAAKTAELKSEISGKYQLQINPKTGKPYKLGDIVEAGAIVIRLENQEHLNSISMETKKMQVNITEREWKGYQVLLEKGGATEKEVMNAESSYISAKLNLEDAETKMEQLVIKAPFKGVIVKLPYFTPNVLANSGEVMLGIMDYSQMYLEIELPENVIDKVIVGQNVFVTNYNIKSDTLQGKVTQLSPAINENTRTFSGFIVIDNPDLKLRPGMFAKGDIITQQRDSVIAIPKEVIKMRRGSGTVFTVERNAAYEKHLKTGISDDTYIEIIDGLQIGDKIVTKGHDWLRNGARVKIMK